MDLPIKAVVRKDESGGYFAEVPAFPGCLTEADTMEELVKNLHDAIEGWLGCQSDRSVEKSLAEEPGDVITL